VYMYTDIHTHAYIIIHTQIRTYKHIHTINTYTHIQTDSQISYDFVYMYTHIHTYICNHTHTHALINTYTHIHTDSHIPHIFVHTNAITFVYIQIFECVCRNTRLLRCNKKLADQKYRARLQKDSVLLCAERQCSNFLFCWNTGGLFCWNTGLFCWNTGLVFRIVMTWHTSEYYRGLFCWNTVFSYITPMYVILRCVPRCATSTLNIT